MRKKSPTKSSYGKYLNIDEIQVGRHPDDGNRKIVIIMYLIMIQSSVICLFVLASHEACDGYCVGFVEPSKNKMAAIYDLEFSKNGKF